MSGAFGGDHDDIQVVAGLNLAEVDVEAVREGEGGTLARVRADLGLVDFGLGFVRGEHHDDGGGFGGFGDFGGFEAGFLGFFPRGAVFAGGDDDLEAGVVEVVCVGVALRAVADNGDGPAFEQFEVGVFGVEDFHLGVSGNGLRGIKGGLYMKEGGGGEFFGGALGAGGRFAKRRLGATRGIWKKGGGWGIIAEIPPTAKEHI